MENNNWFDELNDFNEWNNEVETRVEMSGEINKFGRGIQKMYFLDDNNQHTRNAFFSLEQAKEQVRENFNFEVGKRYIIKYLTNYQWKSGQHFQYNNNLDLSNFVYGIEDEMQMYGEQALDENNVHIYGIVVEEVK